MTSKGEGVKSFTLPKLPYDYTALAPFMSEEQLKLHHDKHHQGYVTGANTIFNKLDKARKDSAELDIKATLRNSVSTSAGTCFTAPSGNAWRRQAKVAANQTEPSKTS